MIIMSMRRQEQVVSMLYSFFNYYWRSGYKNGHLNAPTTLFLIFLLFRLLEEVGCATPVQVFRKYCHPFASCAPVTYIHFYHDASACLEL